TTILNHLYYLDGLLKKNKVTQHVHTVWARKHVAASKEEFFQMMSSEVNSSTPLRIVVVRPPLERLHSAYKDKFGGGAPKKYTGDFKSYLRTSKGLGLKVRGRNSISVTQFLMIVTTF
ncbi:unnamed protein product, partial [Meganyctiphanes norvegica]